MYAIMYMWAKVNKMKKKMNTILSISEARKEIFKIAEEVQKPSNYYTLTEKGRAKAVIMSANEFESWQETMEVMREFPDIDRDIKEAGRAIKSGEYKSWTSLDELLAKEGYLTIADGGSDKYNVSIKNKAKGRKRAK
jgi:prevent-host-death family protein